jgi:hypothetical protein
MPCYTIEKLSLLFSALNRNMLEDAIKALGIEYQRRGDMFVMDGITIGNDEATVTTGFQSQLNAIKRSYSEQIIRKVAKKKKWNGQWKKMKAGKKVVMKRF